MANPLTLMKGLALGAGVMYLFDPRSGRRRRALLRDQLTHMMNQTEQAVQEGLCDLSNRAQGLVAECGSMLTPDHADDRVIVERVRSKLGRCVSHPRAIHVEAHQGRVTLAGPILADEVDHLLATTMMVRGVSDVENRLEVHMQGDHHPALQGGRHRGGERFELMQNTWSPATRLLLGTAGGLLLVRLLGRGPLGLAALGVAGAAYVGSGSGETGQARGMPRVSQSMTSAAL